MGLEMRRKDIPRHGVGDEEEGYSQAWGWRWGGRIFPGMGLDMGRTDIPRHGVRDEEEGYSQAWGWR